MTLTPYCPDCAELQAKIEELEKRNRRLTQAATVGCKYLAKAVADNLMQNCVVQPGKAYQWVSAVLYEQDETELREFVELAFMDTVDVTAREL